MSPDIVCLGEPLVEFNQTRSAETPANYLAGFGGDTSNCAVAAARQGATVGYMTVVGADPFGDALLDLWRREGVDFAEVGCDPSANTGIYFITHADDGHHFTYFRAGSAASRMEPKDLSASYIAGAKVLHVSGISQAISNSACDTIFTAIEVARRNGVRVSYDTNLRLKLWSIHRARAVIHAALALSDIALPGYDDATKLTGLDDPDAIVDFYLGLGVPLVVLKQGKMGALVATPTERRRVEGHVVDVVDATAAGDTFNGAFLAEIVAGRDPFAAAAYGNAAAALSTGGYGAVEPIPRRKEVEALLGRG
jgi:2-dehydro-3-deoxygluconokinase